MVRIVDAAGCVGASAPVDVDADDCAAACQPLACGAITVTPPSACQGALQALSLVVSGGEGPVVVTWDLDGDTVADLTGNPATATDSCANPAPQSCSAGPAIAVVDPCVPGEVSDVRAGEPPLLLLRGSTQVRVEREPDATAYNVYQGAIGSWFVPSPVSPSACFLRSWTDRGDGTIVLDHDLAVGSWILVSASSPGGEGPVGRDSFGSDRASLGAWTRCGAAP